MDTKLFVNCKNKDAYTKSSKNDTTNPQVDHVFEVQLLDLAYENFLSNTNVRMVTRQNAQEAIAHIVNEVPNLNVTTASINNAKKGPFTQIKNQLVRTEMNLPGEHEGIDQFVYTKAGRRRIKDGKRRYSAITDACWDNIKREITASFESISETVRDSNASVFRNNRGEIFLDELSNVFDALQVE